MTLVYDADALAAIDAAGEYNYPFVAYNNFAESGSRTISTTGGTEDADGSGENAVKGTTYDYWIAEASGTAVNLQILFPVNRRPTFAGVAAHNFGTINATVQIEYSTDGGSTWTGSGAGSVEASDNSPIGWFINPEISADMWRLRVRNITGGTIARCGVFFLGEYYRFEQKLYQGYRPAFRPNVVELQSNLSEGGQLLGSAVIRRGSRTSASMAHFRRLTVRRSSFGNFQDHFNSGKGFFWCWRPELGTGEMKWSWRDGGPIDPENTGPRSYMGFEMAMRHHTDET